MIKAMEIGLRLHRCEWGVGDSGNDKKAGTLKKGDERLAFGEKRNAR